MSRAGGSARLRAASPDSGGSLGPVFGAGLLPGDADRGGRALGAARARWSRRCSRGTPDHPLVRRRGERPRAAGASLAAAGHEAAVERPGAGGVPGRDRRRASGCSAWWPCSRSRSGVGAAVFLEEYAPPGRLRRIIQTNIANLAGVPSIVYGILGLAAVRPGLRRRRAWRWGRRSGPGA